MLGSEHCTRHLTHLIFGQSTDQRNLCWLTAHSQMAPVTCSSSMFRSTPALLVSLNVLCLLNSCKALPCLLNSCMAQCTTVQQFSLTADTETLCLSNSLSVRSALVSKLEEKITAHIPAEQPLLTHATLVQDVKYWYAGPLTKLWSASKAIIVSRDSK